MLYLINVRRRKWINIDSQRQINNWHLQTINTSCPGCFNWGEGKRTGENYLLKNERSTEKGNIHST